MVVPIARANAGGIARIVIDGIVLRWRVVLTGTLHASPLTHNAPGAAGRGVDALNLSPSAVQAAAGTLSEFATFRRRIYISLDSWCGHRCICDPCRHYCISKESWEDEFRPTLKALNDVRAD